MVIKIDGTEYEVKFGIGFIRELDTKYTTTLGGNTFGVGLEVCIPEILAFNPAHLSDVLYCGTYTEKKRPTPAQVDQYVESCEDLEALFATVVGELKKQNAARLKAAPYLSQIEATEKQLRQMAAKKKDQSNSTKKS